MKKTDQKILIISGSHDLTCDYLQAKYNNIDFFRLNLDTLSEYEISINQRGFVISNGNNDITSKTCKSIYYRKPLLEDLTGKIDKKYQDFALKESYSLIEGIIESFSGRCLSKPSILRQANNKIKQLLIAERFGLKMPDSLISNSSRSVSNFSKKELLVKPIASGMLATATTKEVVQSNMLSPSISMDSLKFSPAYFQEYIKKDYEVRATFVRNQAFTARIDSENKVDWRKKDNKIEYSNITLPAIIHNRCIALMSALGMQFGCFDFMVKNDEYIFLEMNANGQWAWLEEALSLPISNAIIQHLSE